MSEKTDAPDNGESEPDAQERQPMFSGFGIASSVLGLLCIAAIVLTYLIWSSHRNNEEELEYKARVLQVGVNWVAVLININKDNIESSVQTLHDGTVGELNTALDAELQPFTTFVKTLKTRTTGQITSAAVESVYHDLDRQAGSPPPRDSMPPGLASRTDTVLITATSTSENEGANPQIVEWVLRIGVSNVDGKLLISRLDRLR